MDDETPRCYDGNRQQASSLFPCSLDGSVPQCCLGTQLCASNGLCANDLTAPDDALAPTDKLTRYNVAGCTDSSWQNKGCVSECLEFGFGIDVCPDLGPGYFCCYGVSGCNCTSKSDPTVFKRDNVEFVASLSADGSLPSSTTSSAASADTAAPSDATSAPAANPAVRGSDADDSSLRVGLGVGLGLGIPLIMALVAVFWLWRRRQAKGIPHAKSSIDLPESSDGLQKHEPSHVAELRANSAEPAELPPNYR